MKREANQRNWNPLNNILFEDDGLVIINKPPGISCLQDRTGESDVLTLLRSTDQNFQLCHRIDKTTSGILLAAKNQDSFKFYSKQFEEREVHKLYHAIVQGVFPDEEEEYDGPLEVSGKGKARVSPKGKESLTLVSLLKGFKRFSVLNCMPLTGRFHQIRIHLSNAGYPLAGDELYGGKSVFLSDLKRSYSGKKGREEVAVIARPALHASRIKLKSQSGKEIDVEAPYPADILRLQKILKKYDQS